MLVRRSANANLSGMLMGGLATALLCFFATAAVAITTQDAPLVTPEILPLPRAVEGSVPWQDFYQTKESQRKVIYPDGGYSFEVTPEFSQKLQDMDGKNVLINGFMFPLEQSDKQNNFLIGPYPPSCPFHYHVPPSLIIEVSTQKAIGFSWDVITVEGTLRLLVNDPSGVFYRLENARLK